MPESGFLIFWIFLLLFSKFSCRGSIWAEFGPKIFFSLSRPISSHFGQKYCLKVVFEFFYYFFRNFLAGVEYERNKELKFFSPFLDLSHPVLVKNNAGKRFFFIIFEFFCYFFRNILARVKYERNSVLNFFSLFLNLSHPVLARNNAGKRFFLIFLLFFWEFYCRGPVWAEFGPKIFFSLSRPISSRCG